MAQAGNADSNRLALRPELVVIIGGLIATAHAAVMVTIPAMPAYMDELGAVNLAGLLIGTSLSFGIALSMVAFGRFITNIPGGMLSEKIGRKPVIIGGALIITLFGSLSGAAESPIVFWLYRFLMGVGSAMTITVANVAATDLSTVDNRGRVLGMMHAMQLVVGLSTPALGGLLAAYVDLSLPFYISGAGTAVFAVWAFFRLPETRPPGHHSADASARGPFGAVHLLRDPSFFAVCVIGFSTFFLRGGATTGLIPEYLDEVLDAGPDTLGYLFTVAAVIHGVIVYPSGWASDRWGRKMIIIPAGIVVGVTLAIQPFMQDMFWFVAVFIILHAAVGWGGQAPNAYVGDIAPPGQRGSAFGMYRTFGDLAGIIGPIIALGLAESVNYEVAFGFGATLWMLTILGFWKVAKESAGPGRTHARTMHAPPPAQAERH